MAKYAPLGSFLRRWKRTNAGRSVDLTFTDVERIIGAILPRAASERDWWQNDMIIGRACVHRAAWIDAGFTAFLIDKEKVQFVPRHLDLSCAADGGKAVPSAVPAKERKATG